MNIHSPVTIGPKFSQGGKYRFLGKILSARGQKGNLEKKLLRLEIRSMAKFRRTKNPKHMIKINYIGGFRLHQMARTFGMLPKEYIQPGEIPNGSPRETLERFTRIAWDPYKRQIAQLAQQCGPMHPDCRISAIIPVAAHEEGFFIRRTLEAFTHQTLPRNHFEVVLLANHPDSGGSGKVSEADRTLQEIAEFQRERPDFPLRWAFAVFPEPLATIGYICHVLSDLVIRRHLDRGPQFGDHLMVRTDADVAKVHPRFFEYQLQLFERYPATDSFRGPICDAAEELAQNPILFACSFLEDVIERFLHIKSKRQIWYGASANWAFRASAYARSGGYELSSDFAEDLELGRRLVRARHKIGGGNAVAFARSPATLSVSTRRADVALHHGHCPSEQWTEDMPFAFGIKNALVRKIDPKTRYPQDAFRGWFENPAALCLQLSHFLSRSILCNEESLERYGLTRSPPVQRVLKQIFGLKYKIEEDGGVEVLDLGHFPELFYEFRKRQGL